MCSQVKCSNPWGRPYLEEQTQPITTNKGLKICPQNTNILGAQLENYCKNPGSPRPVLLEQILQVRSRCSWRSLSSVSVQCHILTAIPILAL